MKPWITHVLLGMAICAGFVMAARAVLGIATWFLPELAFVHIPFWIGPIATAWFYIGRERRQSEEWAGSNRIPPWRWKPRALRDAGYPTAAAVALAILVQASPALAESYARGPVRMIDGDTLVLVNGQHVRVLGLDTPEHGGRAHCPRERALADQATERGAELLAGGFTVTDARGRDRYGRRLASITLPDGRDYAAELIAAGLGAAYTGRGPKPNWCAPRR